MKCGLTVFHDFESLFLAFTCSLNADAGVQCGAGSTFKYYYNSQTQNCESFQYNGCDGNSNNFANREACEQYCSVGGTEMFKSLTFLNSVFKAVPMEGLHIVIIRG